MTTKIWCSVVLTAFLAAAQAARAAPAAFGLTPRFIGGSGQGEAPPEMSREPAAVTTYMTASEMQQQVVALTGFSHPAFAKYASVLGKYDPATGRRTTDSPSLLGVLFMQQISTSVAGYVLEREAFLDDSERLVFTRVDLDQSPTDASLDNFLDALHTRWLGSPAGDKTMTLLRGQFRAVETASGASAAYGAVLAILLQHGGLYFY